MADKRLYLIFAQDGNIVKYMNSTIYFMFVELGSSVSLGDGLLDITVDEFKETKVFNIQNVFSLDNREIFSVYKECGIDPESETPIEEQEPKPLPDRKELDDIVFDAIGLTEEERKDVYRAVCRLVWNRISKAKSVKKR